ncbi:MAG: polymer-forming cytoskeletal protein [Pseudomonadota bacterium]
MIRSRKNKPRAKNGAADTLITQHTEINGDIEFNGVLHLDARITGNVSAKDTSESLLSVHQNGVIEGDVKVPHILIMGNVTGDVYASEHIELKATARINGNVYYNLIEMEMGAEVNGQLVHQETKPTLALNHNPDKSDQNKAASKEASKKSS